jgi:hypothetical protein
VSRAVLAVLAAALGLLAVSAPAAAQECPAIGFLSYGGLIYAENEITVEAPPVELGEILGVGQLDAPEGDDPCKRRRDEVQVKAVAGADPGVAVGIDSRPGALFVLGGRCSGYAEAERLGCVLEPLELDGEPYTGVRYPEDAAGRALALAEPIGEATLGDATVTAVRIDGVDPAVAVAVEGRPSEAFVATGACPYERFAAEEAQDDLRRCLEGPLWLVFDPLGGNPGDTITARSDRAVAVALDGARISIVRIDAPGDNVPADLSGAIEIGTLDLDDEGLAELPIVLPDADQGVYETILTCEPCAEAFDGRTRFAAGSFLLLGDTGSGGSGPRIVLIVVGALFLVTLAAALALWRRGWRPRRRPRADDRAG